MANELKLILSGAVEIDLLAAPYSVGESSLLALAEPNVAALYAEPSTGHGSILTDRRFENRTVNFTLKITRTGSTAMDDVQADRNAVAAVLDKARQYALREVVGTRVSDGEVVLKYKRAGGTAANYARVLGGAIGSNPREHSAFTEYKSASTTATDFDVPVTLVLEPFWSTERPVFLRNYLLNGGFEPGVSSGIPYGWTGSTDAGITVSRAESTSFVKSGAKSFLQDITAATGAGAADIRQTVTLADVGLAAGQTIRAAAKVYVYARTSHANTRAKLSLVIKDGASATLFSDNSTAVTTTGSWQSVELITDIPTGATTAEIRLVTEAGAASETITTFWDEVILERHVDNLLLTGNFAQDVDSSGVADNWTQTVATVTATPTLDATAKYDAKSQRVELSGSSGTHYFYQSVTLSTHRVRVGELLTLGCWVLLSGGTVSAKLQLRWLDASSRVIRTDESSATTAQGNWTWLSAAGAMPRGATIARVHLHSTFTAGANSIVRWDWATLYRGYHDGSDGRLWPYPTEWVDSCRLLMDPASTGGKQISLIHTGFRGNVPGPVRLHVGGSNDPSNPLIVGYKRGDPVFTPYTDSSAATDQTSPSEFTTVVDAAFIGGSKRRWTPTNTTNKLLLEWTFADTAPGAYQIVIRAAASVVARFRFQVAARVYSGLIPTAGTWTQPRGAESWVGTGAEYWPLGKLNLPPIDRLPDYVNDVKVQLWGRCTDVSGAPTCDIDGLFLVPTDGYYQGKRGPNSPAYVSLNLHTTVIDSLTPVPGGLTGSAAIGSLHRQADILDILIAQEEPIFVGDTGRIVALHYAGASITRTAEVGLYYRPQWTTAGVDA